MDIQENDPVTALFGNYFMPCILLHKHMHDARERMDAATTEEEEITAFQGALAPHQILWLASLLPLCEGFRKLKLADADMDALIRENIGALRTVAKHVGSYHDDLDFRKGAGRYFIPGPGAGDINSAEELFSAFDNFFAAYFAEPASPNPQ